VNDSRSPLKNRGHRNDKEYLEMGNDNRPTQMSGKPGSKPSTPAKPATGKPGSKPGGPKFGAR
jgi:hypothetical protein